MSKIFVNGNVGKEPEVKYSSAGNRYAKFSLAENIFRQGGNETAWWNVTCFDGKLLEQVEKLKKGSTIGIVGTPDFSAYLPRNGGEPAVSRDVILVAFEYLPRNAGGEKKKADDDF
jgi:single-stranded DNA-binding protein